MPLFLQLSCLLLLVLGCESVRMKHSKFGKSWRVPDDSAADWPSPDQVYFELGESLDGNIILPGGWDYRNGSIMRNYRFNSKFGAIVYPESTSDVQKAILFARDYGIRPTVYSSGHEFLGRSGGDHTLSINMGRMKQLEVDLNDPRSDTNMTMTVGTGIGWADAYTEADRQGVIILGGSCPTVSPGGFILGGGHSPITRTKGLGVDQVVAFTMVTANGSIVYMTENDGIMENLDGTTEPVTDGDLWWAVLGGGGGVYGVITQFVLKLHPAPDGFVRYSVQWIIAEEGECEGVATQALELFLDILRTNLTSNWGGFITPQRNPFSPDSRLGSYTFRLNHWGRNEEEAMSALEEFNNFRTDCQDFSEVDVYDAFWDFYQNVDDVSFVRQYQISTILQEEDLVPGSGVAEMMTDFFNFTELANYITGCSSPIMGGNARNLPQDATSASPDYRNGLVTLVCYAVWALPSQDETAIAGMVQYANDRMYQYGTGAYYNENDYYLQNWQVEFWGSLERYQRLLDVKQRWDPDNMFWCHHCVGSEFA